METIPIVYLPKDFEKKLLPSINIKEIMDREKFKDLYIFDIEGIRKNRPRFCFYQRFSSLFDLWVDAGPRDLGDVVDDVFSGAKKIVLRPGLWSETTIQCIRDITENEVLIAADAEDIESINFHTLDDALIDGFIIFFKDSNQRVGFKEEGLINSLIKKKDVYVFDEKNRSYWESKNIKGFLKDITTFE